MEIRTNRKPRPILSWFELTEKEQKEFDYITNPEESGCSFFRYKGNAYDLGEFMRHDDPYWHGAAADSYFSGVMIHLVAPDYDSVIVGTYFS